MTVYVDNMNAKFRRYIMCHMLADTEEELLEMALKIGMDPKWWQHKGSRKSHFDISLAMKQKAIVFGAVHVTQKELAYMMRDRQHCNESLRKPRSTLSKGN